jgi:hypothetical protein
MRDVFVEIMAARGHLEAGEEDNIAVRIRMTQGISGMWLDELTSLGTVLVEHEIFHYLINLIVSPV